MAISFIISSTFERWSSAHPGWTVIKGGDRSFGSKADLTIVPAVRIGNRSIGPVAFAKREDINFQIMSKIFMDSEIVGALEETAFHF